MGIGFAFIQSPINNAAANALAEREREGGMGLFAGVFFLGGGMGPTLIGAFLAARQTADVDALNPLYAFAAAPFSDAFLALALAPIAALIATLRLRGSGNGGRQRE